MTFSYQAPDRWSPLPEEAFAAIAPAGTQSGTRVLGGVAGPVDATHSFAATIMTMASTIPDDQDDAVVLTDSARLIRDTIGGFIMLEDMAWPATPSGAFLRTGIYIEGTVPITMCQWAWVHRAQGGQRHLITATSPKPTNSTPPATNPPWKQFPRPSYGATSTGSSHPRRHANDHHSMEPR